jgi:rhodanese-related sulfurtransferase
MGAQHSVDELLATARTGLQRVAPCDLRREVAGGALVVDIRPHEQRWRDGPLPGAVVIDRNVLEWRLAPSSEDRIVDVAPGQKVIVVCNEGFSSSLAAATLRHLGLDAATDLIDGFQGLLASGEISRAGWSR